MNRRRLIWIFFAVAITTIILAACAVPTTESLKATAAPAQAATSSARPTQAAAATQPPAPTSAPAATSAPQPTAARLIPLPTIVPTTITEKRIIELEYPTQMRLGDSDIIRSALIPTKDGFTVTAEFPDHQVVTDTVTVARPGGYDLFALARLDAVGFDLSPQAEQTQVVNPDERTTWRWSLTPRSAGQQRLSISITLQWRPQINNPNPIREITIYSKGLNVQVTSFFGLTTRQAAMMGMIGLGIGVTFSLPLAASLLRPRRKTLQSLIPNLSLSIEHPTSLTLTQDEATLLRALFHRYKRITLEKEFRSGYSGARTFLILPVRRDDRADAYTIAKIGERDSIQREYENYGTHVKDTLPPMTARIQDVPVITPTPTLPHRKFTDGGGLGGGKAALRYTFIAEPDVMPTSLRESFLANPDPSLLEKIFSTFGPGWWMQRKPHTFKLGQEYDRLLPAHYVLEPSPTDSRMNLANTIDGRAAPPRKYLPVGDLVNFSFLTPVERRQDGQSWSLVGRMVPGQPPLRVRWLSPTPPNGYAPSRIVATRETLLRDYVADFDLFGLPDPLLKLPVLLDERVMGTQSTLHGDLNLENVLVGPGGFVWLIDFAQTRDGHPLFDFAHLEAEIIAHIIAPQVDSKQWAVISNQVFASGDQQSAIKNQKFPISNYQLLIATLHSIASRCLFNPAHPREYQLALFMACLGGLKYTNLDTHQKHLLYLTAAQLADGL